MGLAINGKVYGTSGVTYIGDKPIDCGYIDEKGNHVPMSLPGKSIFNLLTAGTYLTTLKTLRTFVAFDSFMKGYYDEPEKVPVLIHVPENDLFNLYTLPDYLSIRILFSYFCFLIKYSKTDYSKTNYSKDIMDKLFQTIYSCFKQANYKNLSIIQPPADDLDNFTFSNKEDKPLPIDEFFATYGTKDISNAIAYDIYYKGVKVDFYYRDNTFDYNLRYKTVIYIGGGYGFSVIPRTNWDKEYSRNPISKYVFMKPSNSSDSGIINVYGYTKFSIYEDTVSKPKPTFASYYDTHNYNIAPQIVLKSSTGKYLVRSLCFNNGSDNSSAEGLPKDYTLYDSFGLGCDVPFNPYIFSNIDIDNEYSWLNVNSVNMLKLPTKFNLIAAACSISYPEYPSNFFKGLGSRLPQGKYLVDKSSTTDDLIDTPTNPSSMITFEAKSVDNKFVEQRVYTDYRLDNYNIYYRRGLVGSDGTCSAYTKWFMT